VDAQQWLEQVRAELARKNLPPHYVERLTSELSDHISDFMEDHMSTEAFDRFDAVRPMGTPQHLANSAASEHRQRHFSARHPLITFVMLPILSLPVLWSAILMLIVLSAKLLGFESGSTTAAPSPWIESIVKLCATRSLLVPVAISSAFFCWLAARGEVDRKWIVTACLLVAIFGGAAMVDLTLPGVDHKGSLFFGLSLNHHPSLGQVLQFALPLAICGYAVWRQSSALTTSTAA
jgi:hypothetical protein